MPNYYPFKVAGYFLYFTSKCIVEAMHVHASDSNHSEYNSAKFFVMSDGETTVEKRGTLTDKELNKIRKFIKINYREMYATWQKMSDNGFYEGKMNLF